MRAQIKAFHSPDADLKTFSPLDPRDFGLLLQLLIGPEDQEGSESFDIVLCSPRWVEKKCEAEFTFPGLHTLIVREYDWGLIQRYLHRVVSRTVGVDWQELASKLSKLGRWEFEDYQT